MWENIRTNKLKSVLLFVFMGALFLVFGYLLGHVYFSREHAEMGILIASIVWLLLSVVSIHSGGRIILQISGARRAKAAYFQQLFDVVEEMAIAAGLAVVPEIFLIQDDSPNAFATGRSPRKSAITVTTGLISLLDRDELQGVIAHETAHIANSDSMFMTFSGIILGCISLVAEVFLKSFGLSRRKETFFGLADVLGIGYYILKVTIALLILYAVKDIIGAVLLTLAAAIIIPYFVKVLFYAVSRKREFLADAIAVQLTRYPEGLASALEKIRNNAQEQLSVNSMNEAMFIVNPYCSSAMSIWNIGKTHPSTTDRIRILRSIGAAEGFGNYHEAFRSTTGMQHRQMARSKKLQDILEIRPAFEEATYSDTSDQPAAQNAFPETHSHSFIDCTCGMKLKIPDGFGTNKPEVICPACGRRYAV